MSFKLLLVFAITEFLMSLTPGPAVFLVVSQGIRVGFRAGLLGTAGILGGNVVYFALSAAGLGALLIASAKLFQIIKWLGVVYLLAFGLKMLLFTNKASAETNQATASKRSLALFSQGLATQLSNPRAIVFFTALLPQFISGTGGSPVGSHLRIFWQFIVLGIISITVELPVLAAYGWIAERGGSLIPKRFSSLPERVAGGFLIGAGIGLASMRRL